MKPLLFSIFAVLVFTIGAQGQAIKPTSDASEFGDIKELARAHKVYVWANDLEARKIVVKELSKDSLLEIVDRLEDAEFALTYGLETERRSVSFLFGGIQSNQRQTSDMMALRSASAAGRERDAVRIVWSTRKVREYSNGITFSRHPAINGTRSFLKALNEARSSAANLANAPTLTPMRSLTNEREAPAPAPAREQNAPAREANSASTPAPAPTQQTPKKACYEGGYKVPCPNQ